jgi:methylenetetrahydrofolate dehydrogenase (NADP+)/methenyltetrahydrofolate cyclohydrolase
MTAQIIDGKAQAETLRAEVAGQVYALRRRNLKPGLAVVIVGNDPASEVYVRNKVRQTTDVGMMSLHHILPANAAQSDVLALVDRLNADPEIDGVLVQLPLPAHIDAAKIIEAIDPLKDVDGFHPVNAGRLMAGLPGLVPCTPLGCMLLLRSVLPKLAGREAVVIGRSNIVGLPVARLLLQADCTVTMAHSRTERLAVVCRRADIVIAAAGRPHLVRGDWIKRGAVVIDVGINRQDTAAGVRLVGDVNFNEAVGTAQAITPVPGGVGPMTIACLLRNTVDAACRRRGLPPVGWAG